MPVFAAITSSAFDDEQRRRNPGNVAARRSWQSPVHPIDKRALVPAAFFQRKGKLFVKIGHEFDRHLSAPCSHPNALRRRPALAGRRNQESARVAFLQLPGNIEKMRAVEQFQPVFATRTARRERQNGSACGGSIGPSAARRASVGQAFQPFSRPASGMANFNMASRS